MATAYSAKQLDILREVFSEERPPLPNSEDMRGVPQMIAFSSVATGKGLLLSAVLDDRSTITFLLSPVAAIQMARHIIDAGDGNRWWDAGGVLIPASPGED